MESKTIKWYHGEIRTSPAGPSPKMLSLRAERLSAAPIVAVVNTEYENTERAPTLKQGMLMRGVPILADVQIAQSYICCVIHPLTSGLNDSVCALVSSFSISQINDIVFAGEMRTPDGNDELVAFLGLTKIMGL